MFEGRVGSARLHLVDAARGLAIAAMVVFHIAWDLYYLGFIATNVIEDPGWVAFQRSIVTAFLLLVGVGLVLGHGDGVRWRAFWRRFAIIGAAALLTSIGTYIAFPDYFAYFGILHAIAVFSLFGLAFVRVPVALTLAVALLVLVLPALVTDSVMTTRHLSWIGLWPTPPPTADIVPVFPWFGVVLLGIAGTQLGCSLSWWPRLEALRFDGAAGSTLRFMGRWSLVIYLVHQPVLFGGLGLVADWMGTPPLM